MSITMEKDWRVGLTMKTKSRSHEYYYEPGEVLDVLPSGTGGVYDDNDVLKLKLAGGQVVLEPARDWKMA